VEKINRKVTRKYQVLYGAYFSVGGATSFGLLYFNNDVTIFDGNELMTVLCC